MIVGSTFGRRKLCTGAMSHVMGALLRHFCFSGSATRVAECHRSSRRFTRNSGTQQSCLAPVGSGLPGEA
jgi:hypothetical protein